MNAALTSDELVPVLVVADPGYVGQEAVAEELGSGFDVTVAHGLDEARSAAAALDWPVVLLPQQLEPAAGTRILAQLRAQDVQFVGVLMVDEPDVAPLLAVGAIPGVHAIVARPLRRGVLALHLRAAANTRAALRAARRTAGSVHGEMDDLLHTLRHEVRGQLQGVVGLSGLLLEFEREHLGEEAVEWCQRMEQSGERIARLIDDIVTYLRLGRRRLEPAWVDVGQLVEELFDEIRFGARDPDALDLRFSPPSFRVWADRRGLALALSHLVSNAIRFNMRPIKRVRIGVAAGDPRGQRTGGFTVSVSDNGVGVRDSDRERIFGLFEKRHIDDDGALAGAGIGLALVEKLAQMHGGEAWVASEQPPTTPDDGASLAAGATFCVWLPDEGA